MTQQSRQDPRDFSSRLVTRAAHVGAARSRLAASTALVAPAAAFQAERSPTRALAASLLLAGLVALNIPIEARAQVFGGDGGVGPLGTGAGLGGGVDQTGGDAALRSGAGGGGGGPTSSGAAKAGGSGNGAGGAGGAGGINGFDSGSGAFGSGTNYSGTNGGNGFGVFGSGGGGGGGAGGFGAVIPGTGTFGSTANITAGAGGNGGTVQSPGYGYGLAGRGGAGGGGGIGVYATGASTLTTSGTVTGGAGGAGGNSLGGLTGGDGGAGGAGYFSNTAGTTLGNSGTIRGGAGTSGGASDTGENGAGGAGGAGAILQAGGTLTNAISGVIVGGQGAPGANGGAGVILNNGTLTTSGVITGGNGGFNFAMGAGAGGVGVTGSNLSIVTAGTIAGGQIGTNATAATLPGGTGPIANAVVFTGGVNSLTLHPGYAFDGNVIAFNNAGTKADTLALGGAGTASFNVGNIDTGANTALYQNFGKFNKVDSSTWTLTGTTTAVTPWSVLGGTLAVSTDAALGDPTGRLTMNGGTLQTTATIGMTRPVSMGLAGGTFLTDPNTVLTLNGTVDSPGGSTALTKAGAGTLVLAGNNTYAGVTNVNAGVLQLTNANSAGTSGINLGNGTTLGFLNSGYTIGNAVALPGAGQSATIDSGAGSVGIGGIISGAGALNKIGAGTLALSGANTYSGGTNVNAGTLSLNNASAAGTGSLAFAGGTTLGFTGANFTLANAMSLPSVGQSATLDTGTGSYGVSGIISGAGALNKIGAGTLALSGVNTYSGGTNVNAGTLSLNNASAAGTGPLAFAGGTTLGFTGANFTLANNMSLPGAGQSATFDTGTGSYGVSGIISGAGALNKIGAGTLALSGVNTYSGGTNVNAGTLALMNANGAGTGAIGLGANTTLAISTPGSVANNVVLPGAGAGASIDPGTFSATISGTISGAGLLNKINTGTLFLTQNNTYSGGTNVVAGGLSLSSQGSAGTGAIALGANTSLFVGTQTGFSLSNDIALPSAGSSATVISGGLTGSTLTGTIGGAGTLLVGNHLTLAGNNTYSGGTTVEKDFLTLTNANAAGTGAISLLANTTLGFTGASYTLANVVALPGLGQSATLDTGNGSYGVSGLISGAGALNKIGAGTLALSGVNTYSGGTTVNAGTLSLANANAAGTGPLAFANATTLGFTGASFTLANNVSLTGSSATFDTGTGSYGVSGIVSGAGALNKIGAGTLALSGVNTYSGGTNVNAGALSIANANAAGTGPLAFANNTTLGFTGTSFTLANNVSLAGASATFDTGAGSFGLSGIISGAGALNKAGTGTLALSGINTYSGGTNVLAGTLSLANANAAGTGTITMSSDTALALTGQNFTLANPVKFAAAGDPTIDSGPGTMTMTGGITGIGDLTKIGAGTLVLGGNNTFNGNTFIGQGILQLDGTLNPAYTTYVGYGTALTGSGTVGSIAVGNPVVTNVTPAATGLALISPGSASNPYGTLTARGSVTMNTNTVFSISYNSTSASSLAVSGLTNIGGATLNVTGNGTPAPGTRLPILTGSNIQGTFTTVNYYGTAAAGAAPTVVYNPTEVDLQFADNIRPTYQPPVLDYLSVIGSVDRLANDRFGQFVTLRILSSILGGFNEQINCTNCITGFGSVGSFSAGFHGRKAITDDIWLIGGAAFAQYKSGGARITSAPILAASLRYDPSNWGPSRPYAEIGGVFAPAQRGTFSRSYGAALGSAGGTGTTSTTTATVFGRLGWVWRLTPRDELSANAEVSGGWQRVSGYSEGLTPGNPYPLNNTGGTDRVNIAKFGGQWTHLFGSNIETQANIGVARSFGSRSGLNPITAFGSMQPQLGEHTWAEYGLRAGYRIDQNMVIDAFTDGTLGAKPVGNTIHGGLAARYTF